VIVSRKKLKGDETTKPRTHLMSQFRGLFSREFVYLVVILACIAGSLFLIFSFLATAEFGEALGASLFLVVTGLLIGGYLVGLMVVALLGIALLTKLASDRKQATSVNPPAKG